MNTFTSKNYSNTKKLKNTKKIAGFDTKTSIIITTITYNLYSFWSNNLKVHLNIFQSVLKWINQKTVYVYFTKQLLSCLCQYLIQHRCYEASKQTVWWCFQSGRLSKLRSVSVLVLTLLTSCRGVRSLRAVPLWPADGRAGRNVGRQRASMATPDRTWGCWWSQSALSPSGTLCLLATWNRRSHTPESSGLSMKGCSTTI